MAKSTRAVASAMLCLLMVFPAIPAAPVQDEPWHQPPLLQWHDDHKDMSGISPAYNIAPRSRGTLNILMLCIEFTNVQHQTAHTPSYHENLSDGTTNSMNTYFQQASYGKVNITADCQGWFTSTQSMEFYGTPSGQDHDNPQLYKLVTEAVYAADSSVNFSQYDGDGDGWLDYLMIVHSGNDQAVSGSPNDIWSHKYYNIDQPTVDGKKVGWYSMVSEFSPMGVLAHEFGHQLGMPDLYDTDGGGSGGDTDGAGQWDIMAAGAFLNMGATPSLPSAWSRALVGWAKVVNITGNQNSCTLQSADTCSTVLRLNIPGLANEYFLLENRRISGYDTSLPGQGLLIWHIDESQGIIDANNIENRPGKKRITLEESHGGKQNLDDAGDNNWGDYRDPWYSSGGGFNPISNPNSSAQFDGRCSFISVRNISPSSLSMSFDIVLDTRVYNLRLTPTATSLAVDPGVVSSYGVYIKNFGSAETYNLVLEGNHPDWFTLSTPSVTLPVDGEELVTVSVNPPLSTPANSTSQNTFKVTASSDGSKFFYTTINTKVNLKLHGVITSSQELFLLPGERRSVNITVSNQGNAVDTITVSITGDGASWVEYPGPTAFPLSPAKSATFELFVSVPWGSAENAKALVMIGGRSKDNSPAAAARLNLTAMGAPNLLLEGPTDAHLLPGVPMQWNVRVTNAGTVDKDVTLAAAAPSGWMATLSQTPVTISAWSYQDVTVAITPPQGARAGTVTAVSLTASAGDHGNSTQVNLVVDQLFAVRVAGGSTNAEIAPDAAYEYKLTVENSGNGPDRLRFSLAEGEGGAGWAQALDISNALVEPGQNITITVTVTAPAAAPAGAQWILSLNIQHSNLNSTLVNLVSKVAQVRAVYLSCNQKVKTAIPGEEIEFSLGVENKGNANDVMVLSVVRQSGIRFDFSGNSVTLDSGGTASVLVYCKVEATALAGARSINVTAATTNASINSTVELKLTIASVWSSSTTFKETRKACDAGKTVAFQFTVENKGNAQDTFTFSKTGGPFTVKFEKASIGLKPGAAATVNVTVEVPGGESGGLKTLKISVRSAGKGADIETKDIVIEVKAKGIGGTPGFEIPLLLAAAAAAIGLAGAERNKKKK